MVPIFGPRENVTLCGQQSPRSACAFAQSDQGLHSPLTESLDTAECMNEEQRPEWYVVHAQDFLNLRILCTFGGTLSLDAAHINPMLTHKKTNRELRISGLYSLCFGNKHNICHYDTISRHLFFFLFLQLVPLFICFFLDFIAICAFRSVFPMYGGYTACWCIHRLLDEWQIL